MRTYKKIIGTFIILFALPVIMQAAYWGYDAARINNSSIISSALGGAYCAGVDDVSGILNNPAGIMNIPFNQLYFSGTQIFNLYYTGQAAAAVRISPKIKLGAAALYRNVPNIKYTVFDNGLVKNAGSFNSSSVMFAGTIGYMLTRRLYSGINMKFISDKLNPFLSADMPQNTRYAGSADFGVMWLPLDFLQFGINLQNVLNTGYLSSGLHYELLPITIKTGIALNLFAGKMQVLADYDGTKTNNYLFPLHIGARYLLNEKFTILAGYGNNEYTSGLLFRYGSTELQYAFQYSPVLGANHKLGISYRFGQRYKNLKNGAVAFRKGNYDSALSRFAEILRKNPNDRAAKQYVKIIGMRLLRDENIRMNLIKTESGDNQWADYWLNKAWQYDNALKRSGK